MALSALVEPLAIAAGVYGLIKLETFYHIWRFRQQQKRRPVPVSPKRLAGIVSGSANPIMCHHCGVWVSKFADYTDGDKFCLGCHERGVI